MIFSIFRFFCTLRFQIFKILSYHNKPYINGKLIYSAFRWCINLDFKKLTLMTGFVVRITFLLINFWLKSDAGVGICFRHIFQTQLTWTEECDWNTAALKAQKTQRTAHVNRVVWLYTRMKSMHDVLQMNFVHKVSMCTPVLLWKILWNLLFKGQDHTYSSEHDGSVFKIVLKVM